MDLQQARTKLEKLKGMKEKVMQDITHITKELKDLHRSLIRHEEAKEVIRAAGKKTQDQLSFHISDITSLAMSAVFDDPYELKIDFVQRRNKTECDLFFVRDEVGVDPLTSSGVGAVDVAAFALRIACWSMNAPRTRNVIIMDEPFKHLRGEVENERVLEMLQNIAKIMKVQIIIVGDVKVSKDTLLEYADKVFECSIKNRVTKIKVL